MLRLSQRGHRVLFVERQVGPEQLIRNPMLRSRKFRAWRFPGLRQPTDNLWLYQPPLLPPGRYYSVFLNRLGQDIMARSVQKMQVKLSLTAPILWLYPPQSAPLLGKFGEVLSIYHCIENFSGDQHGMKRRVMQSEERQLLRNADLVFTHSHGLLKLYAGLTRRQIKLVPSAADVAHFQSTSAVDPLVSQIPYPRLGVVGTLDARLDADLLEKTALSQPDWHLILIGQWHPERINLNLLLKLPNVHYLGWQPFARLPALLNGIDVFLIPYVLTEMTKYISPIKLYEYLAVGKPIVSTHLPEVSIFKEHICIAGNSQEFIHLIREALTNDTPDQVIARRNLSRQHSWESRLDVMLEAIAEALRDKINGEN
jgi:glycosyltransferase involved in cell wall biosynthesis